MGIETQWTLCFIIGTKERRGQPTKWLNKPLSIVVLHKGPFSGQAVNMAFAVSDNPALCHGSILDGLPDSRARSPASAVAGLT